MRTLLDAYGDEAVRWGWLIIKRRILAEEMVEAGFDARDVDFWAFEPSRRVSEAPLDDAATRSIFRALDAGDMGRATEIAEAAQ
jgi:hypothetical protein